MHIAIIGLGLIGGSAALAWKRAAARGRLPFGELTVAAADTRRETLALARRIGAADRVTPSAAEAMKDADLVLCAVPVLAIEGVMREFAKSAPEGCIFTDAGSVRASVIAAARRAMPERLRRYAPYHPIAGAEKAGLENASPDLFEGAAGVLTPLPETDADAGDTVAALWECAGLRTVRMTPEAHDRVYALVSHVPHMIAFALMNTAASAPEHDTALRAAGGGFRDTTRIAAADPRVWADIACGNREAVLDGIDRFSGELAALRALVAEGDEAKLERYFARAAEARRAMASLLPPKRG
jgi:prephenate dehydrogenase